MITLQVELRKTRRGKLLSPRSEEHTSELQSRLHLVCRLLLDKKRSESGSQRLRPGCRRAAHPVLPAPRPAPQHEPGVTLYPPVHPNRPPPPTPCPPQPISHG